MFVMINYNRI